MKKILFILAIVCCTTTTIVAQQRKHLSHEEYCKQLQTFITERAKLTPDEAKAFFPIYFEFQQNKWKINKEARKKLKCTSQESPNDEELRGIVNEIADAEIRIAQLKKEYIAKYLEIIPPRKILDVQHAEDRFQREIIKKMARENNNKKETPNN
jgi:hypothetical protein